MIRLAWPDVGPEEAAAVAEVLESGQLTMGPKVREFEEELARACRVEHAVAVSSGTAALHLALLAAGIGEGDRVVVPAYTFPATANVVELSGAEPVLCDVDPETMNLDLERLPGAVAEARAILAVHLFGRPLDWDALEAAAPDVLLIEDAAGALGASWDGRPCGSLGRLGCLSFHPRKVVTTGEGGAVTTDDDGLAEAVRRLRHHGIPSGDFDVPEPGFNYRLSDIQCAVGLPQLRRLEELVDARRRLAAAYAERLDGIVQTPTEPERGRHGWQAYVVRLDRRDEALAALRDAGIEAQIGTYALHRLSAYRGAGEFPGADACYERALALPFHSKMTEPDLDQVTEVLASVVSS